MKTGVWNELLRNVVRVAERSIPSFEFTRIKCVIGDDLKQVWKGKGPDGKWYFEKEMNAFYDDDSADIVKRFMREVFMMALFEKSGLTVPVHTCTVSPGEKPDVAACFRFYTRQMETSVDGVIGDRRFSVAERMMMAFDCALAVFMLHSFLIHHRDVKDGNFFVENGHALISDFESARPRQNLDEILNSFNWHTPACAAPEVLQNNNMFSFPADIYALGTVLYELVTGKRFDRDNLAEISNDGRMDELIALCFDYEPSGRITAYVIVRFFVDGDVWFPGIKEEDKRKVQEQIRIRYANTVAFIDSLHGSDPVIDIPASWTDVLRMFDKPIPTESDIRACAFMLHNNILFDRDDRKAAMMADISNIATTRQIGTHIRRDKSEYSRGCAALVKGKVAKAIALFKAGIKKRCHLCLTQLALLLCEQGDSETGVKLLRIAAKAGDTKAMFHLGIKLYEVSQEEAMFWLNQAKRCGHQQALFILRLIELMV